MRIADGLVGRDIPQKKDDTNGKCQEVAGEACGDLPNPAAVFNACNSSTPHYLQMKTTGLQLKITGL